MWRVRGTGITERNHNCKILTFLYFCHCWKLNVLRTTTRFLVMLSVTTRPVPEFYCWVDAEKSPFQRLWLVCFLSNRVFVTICTSLLHSLHMHKIWKKSVGKYKSCGTLSKTTHFLHVLCEGGVVQLCTEAQTGVVQDGLKGFMDN